MKIPKGMNRDRASKRKRTGSVISLEGTRFNFDGLNLGLITMSKIYSRAQIWVPLYRSFPTFCSGWMQLGIVSRSPHDECAHTWYTWEINFSGNLMMWHTLEIIGHSYAEMVQPINWRFLDFCHQRLVHASFYTIRKDLSFIGLKLIKKIIISYFLRRSISEFYDSLPIF